MTHALYLKVIVLDNFASVRFEHLLSMRVEYNGAVVDSFFVLVHSKSFYFKA